MANSCAERTGPYNDVSHCGDDCQLVSNECIPACRTLPEPDCTDIYIGMPTAKHARRIRCAATAASTVTTRAKTPGKQATSLPRTARHVLRRCASRQNAASRKFHVAATWRTVARNAQTGMDQHVVVVMASGYPANAYRRAGPCPSQIAPLDAVGMPTVRRPRLIRYAATAATVVTIGAEQPSTRDTTRPRPTCHALMTRAR